MARFRFGTGAPADDLADELDNRGYLVYETDACEELGDYCVIEGTDADVEQLCDELGGVAIVL